MTVDKPTSVVPECRFPEFRSAGDWHFKPLSDIAAPISDRVGMSKCEPMSVTSGVGLVSQEEKFGRTIAGSSYKNYIRLQTNDFAYNKSATKEFPQGYIARYSGTIDAAVPNSIFACFRPDIAAVIPEYLDHLFHRNHHGQWLRKYITVGARAHGALSVSNDDLMSMPVPLPPDAASGLEQQKIADCLGSLDDLIAAERRKLEALRQHKRGLMQQLFPQPGESVPRLRFSEFQRDGDWKLDQIGNVASITKGKRVSKADITKGGGTPCIRYAELYTHYREVIREVVSHTNVPHEDLMLSQAEDVIVPASGETRVDIARAACVLAERVALGSDLNILRSDLYGPFFSYLLNSPLRQTIARVAQGDTVAHLYPKQLSQVWLAYPLRLEQQKIADCLGSLDNLIAGEDQKLDLLKTHKQGLLQQLFPSPEAV
ncbi:MAG: restriction endonuclease subunit S [Bryobacterales bacterium]|nr:restriction endonuclease subunit S [Bryobacterales bacterium]